MSTYLRSAIQEAGPAKIAEKSGVSTRAVYKWLYQDKLPRTELTGETDYASIIAKLCPGRGVTRKRLIDYTRTQWQSRVA